MPEVYIVNWNNDYNETMERFLTKEALLEELKLNFEVPDHDDDGDLLDDPNDEDADPHGPPIVVGSPEFFSWISDAYNDGDWKGLNIAVFNTETLELKQCDPHSFSTVA